MKPVFAITMGDPAGIGPEVLSRNLNLALRVSHPVIFGHWPTMEQILATVPDAPMVRLIDAKDIGRNKSDEVQFVHLGPDCGPIEIPGKAAALAQFAALEAGTATMLDGCCDALVTGPVSKSLINTIIPGFIGHTEYLAQMSGVETDDVTMTFAGKELTIGLVSTHLPMRDIADAINVKSYQRTLDHVITAASAAKGNAKPKVAVAAFNPHAGEEGLLGLEESEVLEPFCNEMRLRDDVDLYGPISADAVFRDALNGQYDGVVAAYHDQAMIPIKLLGFGKTANVTMGLPFVRTSPDHGTAYNLVGTGKADPSAMKLAIEMAAFLAAGSIQRKNNALKSTFAVRPTAS